jgi:hypothetical protein
MVLGPLLSLASSSPAPLVSLASLPPAIHTALPASLEKMLRFGDAESPPVSGGLHVALRIRPLNKKELQSDTNSAFRVIPELNSVLYCPNQCQASHLFQADDLFDETDSIETIYHQIGHGIIQQCVHGSYGAIFACDPPSFPPSPLPQPPSHCLTADRWNDFRWEDIHDARWRELRWFGSISDLRSSAVSRSQLSSRRIPRPGILYRDLQRGQTFPNILSLTSACLSLCPVPVSPSDDQGSGQ